MRNEKSSVVKEYIGSLKSIEVEEILDLIFYRPLAFVFVKIIKNTGITPNQVTLWAMILGVIGGVFLATGVQSLFVYAAILFILYDVLDCADGQLARINKNGTPIGRVLDGLSDYVVNLIAYMGIGFGFAQNTDNPAIWWLLMIAAGLSNVFHASLLDYYRNRFLDIKLSRKSVLDEELREFSEEYEQLKEYPGNAGKKMLLRIYFFYSGIQRKMASGKESVFMQFPDAELFVAKNKKIIHFWTYLGPTSQLSFLIICILLNRLDIYIIGLLTAANAIAIILLVIQKIIDSSYQSYFLHTKRERII